MAHRDVKPVPPFVPTYSMADRVGTFPRAVYGWMCAGLLITGIERWLRGRRTCRVFEVLL
jgi:hypothetical protein